MSDLLRMDHINSLPQPFFAQFFGDSQWWPVIDFEVQTGLMRIDVCGLLQVKSFADVKSVRDGHGDLHDPDSFYNEDAAQ